MTTIASRKFSSFLLSVTCLTSLTFTGCSISLNGRPLVNISGGGMPGMPGSPETGPGMPAGPGIDPSQQFAGQPGAPGGMPGQPLGGVPQIPNLDINISTAGAAAPGSPLTGPVAGQFQPPSQVAAPGGALQPTGSAPSSPQSVATASVPPPGSAAVPNPSSVPAGNNPPPVPTTT